MKIAHIVSIKNNTNQPSRYGAPYTVHSWCNTLSSHYNIIKSNLWLLQNIDTAKSYGGCDKIENKWFYILKKYLTSIEDLLF